jgi:putative tricarboxylic transport membrane protein
MSPSIDLGRIRMLCPLMLALALGATAAPAAAPSWKPERTVEFIIPAGPGGGQDRTARTIQKILQDAGLVPTPINIINRGGGGGNIAYGYLQQFKGDGHYVATASPTLITNHILGSSPVAYTDITPLAVLYSEYIGYAVQAGGPFKTGADLMERLRKDPESVIFAFGTSRGNANHIAVAQLAKAVGVDPKRLKVVIYKSSIDAATALMGGHVMAVATPTSTYVPVLDTGKLRLVGIAAPTRQGGVFAEVPTWKEQGHNVLMPSYRMLIGPGGMTPAQIGYWDRTLSQLPKNADWQKELERNDWDNSYMDSARSRAFLDEQAKSYRAALIELGLVKP